MMGLLRNTYFLLGLLAVAFCLSCAQVKMPGGGPRDEEPPKILATSPKNLSINTKPEKITIQLDEYFQLDNPTQNITFSPPLDKTPEFITKGKSLVIKMPKDTLEENTTYTINFGAAIKDNNEGNIQDSFTFVFSTGPYIDSLFFAGKVIQAETCEPEEGMVVGLYKSLEDSIVFEKKPFYYVKTRKDGSFMLKNLKGGTYKLFAFKDENSNFIKDMIGERIAFFPEPITISPDTSISYLLHSFLEEQPFKIKEFDNKEPGRILLVFSDPLQSIKISSDTSVFPIADTIHYLSESKDSLFLYYSFPVVKSSKLIIEANGAEPDSQSLSFKTVDKDSFFVGIPTISTYSGEISRTKGKGMSGVSVDKKPVSTTLSIDFFSPLIFRLNRPIQSFTTQKLIVELDSVGISDTGFLLVQTSPVEFSLFPPGSNAHWEQGKVFKLSFADSSFVDISGKNSPAIEIVLNITNQEDYGEVIIQIDSLKAEKSYFTELLGPKGTIVSRETIAGKTTATYKYNNLLPGSYKLKIIQDENQNNEWDTGNYLQSIQPEPIIYFPENIDVRAKWENEVKFSLKKPKKIEVEENDVEEDSSKIMDTDSDTDE